MNDFNKQRQKKYQTLISQNQQQAILLLEQISKIQESSIKNSYLLILKMNFTKLMSQLNKVQQKNHQIDQKFMTTQTYNKKYQNRQKINLQLHNSSTKLSRTESAKQSKHRYYQDIKQDEIEDQNIFGFSFYQYLFSQKNKNSQTNKKSNLLISTNKRKSRDLLQNRNSQAFPNTQQVKQKNPRLKTVIIQHGVPTKRKVHHKLTLNQPQKDTITQNFVSPSQSKQQFFNQTFFNFKSQEKQNIKKSNFRNGPRYSSPNIQGQKSQTFINKNSISNFKNQLSTKNLNEYKNGIDIDNTFKNFYKKNDLISNLKKKKKYQLDFQKIQEEKAKFSKEFQGFFQNFTKKDNQTQGNQNLLLSKSIIYEKKQRPVQKSQNLAEKQRVKDQQFKFQDFKEDKNIQSSEFIDENNSNIQNNHFDQQKSGIKRVNFQSQLTQKVQFKAQEFLTKNKLTFDLQIIRQTNPLFLQCHQLAQVQFRQDSKVSFIQNKIIQEILDMNTVNKEFTSKSLKDFSSKSLRKIQYKKIPVYKLFLFIGSTLECLTLEDIKISQEGIFYNGKFISIFLLCQKLLSKKIGFDFIHVLITRRLQDKKNQKFTTKQVQQDLLFETFVHNCDIKYFQGREVEIQYFKYFLKRFITFDQSFKNRKQMQESHSLIMESEVSIPPEFQQFCYDIDIKGDINIFTIKNQNQMNNDPLLKCLNIDLSTLLINAQKSIQMIKKDIFEGYNWKGVSLKKQLQKKTKANQLQHFYI